MSSAVGSSHRLRVSVAGTRQPTSTVPPCDDCVFTIYATPSAHWRSTSPASSRYRHGWATPTSRRRCATCTTRAAPTTPNCSPRPSAPRSASPPPGARQPPRSAVLASAPRRDRAGSHRLTSEHLSQVSLACPLARLLAGEQTVGADTELAAAGTQCPRRRYSAHSARRRRSAG
jgi:hypothetical protein